MPRQAKYVRIVEDNGNVRRVEKGGREVFGLHYRRTTPKGKTPERGIYFKRVDGQRVDLGSDLAQALAELEDAPNVTDAPVYTEALDLAGQVQTVATDLAMGAPGNEHTSIAQIEDGKRKLHALLASANGAPVMPSDKRLSDCLSVWADAKRAEGVTGQHIEDVSAYFNAFVKCAGDLPLNELTAEHFTKFRASVNRRRKSHSILWVGRHHKWVKHVLKFAKYSYPSWGLPDGVLEWASAYQVVKGRERYSSPKKNRQCLPVDAFGKLLAEAEAWAATPVDADKTTQSGRAKRNRQQDKRREGLRMVGLLKLAANCGLANVDIMGIRWRNLKLSDKMPHMDFPRRKTEDVTGEVDRFTPLLPSTIRALQAVRQIGNPSPYVFVAGRGKAYTKSTLDHALARLFHAAKVKAWTFKHLRNIGSSLNKREKPNGMPDMRDEFLGHNEKGTNKFYTDDVGPEYLKPVVNAIGKAYFDGETVGASGLSLVS